MPDWGAFKRRLQSTDSYGNAVDLNRPAINNPDGTISTERSITVQADDLNGGQPTNIPTIWEGKQLSERDAIRRAVLSGQKYPAFRSIEEAVNAARQRSEDIGRLRGGQ